LIDTTISLAEKALAGVTVSAAGALPTCAFHTSRKSGMSSAPATWTCALTQLAKLVPAASSVLSIFFKADSACRRIGSSVLHR
jgi:hypothetical protein